MKIEEFPRIRVYIKDGMLYSLDNRRLWLFKQTCPRERLIYVDLVEYDIAFGKRFTSRTGISLFFTITLV